MDILNDYSTIMEVPPRIVDNAVIFFKLNTPPDTQPVFIDRIITSGIDGTHNMLQQILNYTRKEN